MKSFESHFAPFLGNGHLKKQFKEMLDTAPLHALLIVGDDGAGRNMFAELIAEYYLSDERDLVRRGYHPDCITVSGSGISGTITVDAVREAVFEAGKSAVTTDLNRVVLIKNCDNLNRSSSAALLKALEEPRDGVIYVLTAPAESDIIETVRSRCAVFQVLPLSPDECIDAAKNLFPKADLSLIPKCTEVFGGRLGLVKDVLADKSATEKFLLAERYISLCRKKSILSAAGILDSQSDRAELILFLKNAVHFVSYEYRKAAITSDTASDYLTALQEAVQRLQKNVNLKLVCTKLAATMAGIN